MQVRHLPNRDHRDGGVTTLKCASAHVPRFLTGSSPPISHRQLPFRRSIAQAVYTAHRRAAAGNGFLERPSPPGAGGFLSAARRSRVRDRIEWRVSRGCADLAGSSGSASRSRLRSRKLPACAASRSSTQHALLQHGIPGLVVMPSVFSFAARYVVKGAAQSRDRSRLCRSCPGSSTMADGLPLRMPCRVSLPQPWRFRKSPESPILPRLRRSRAFGDA